MTDTTEPSAPEAAPAAKPWFHSDGDPDAVPTLVRVRHGEDGTAEAVTLDSGDGLTFTVRLSDRVVHQMSDWNRFWGYPLMRTSNFHSGKVCEGCTVYIGPLPDNEALAAADGGCTEQGLD